MKGMKQLRTVKLQGENSPFQNCIFNGFLISLKKSIARVFPKSNLFGENVVPKLRGLC